MSGIVVGVDGSDSSRDALRWALGEALLRGTTLRLIHAWGMPYAPAATGYVPLPVAPLHDAAGKGAQRLLDEACSQVETGDVRVEPLLVEGAPASALLEAAKDAEMVVVGSRGTGGFVDLLLGSVGQQVIHHATCPVVVVR